MTVKLVTSCSGANFSYHQDQVVGEIDPAVGADLVKHGLAVELDAGGKPVEAPVQEESTGNSADDSEKEASTGGESADNQTEGMDNEQRNLDESEAETADVTPEGETTTVEDTNAQTATVKPKAETRRR